jgi:hypothetical protein
MKLSLAIEMGLRLHTLNISEPKHLEQMPSERTVSVLQGVGRCSWSSRHYACCWHEQGFGRGSRHGMPRRGMRFDSNTNCAGRRLSGDRYEADPAGRDANNPIRSHKDAGMSSICVAGGYPSVLEE